MTVSKLMKEITKKNWYTKEIFCFSTDINKRNVRATLDHEMLVKDKGKNKYVDKIKSMFSFIKDIYEFFFSF